MGGDEGEGILGDPEAELRGILLISRGAAGLSVIIREIAGGIWRVTEG
jgi:hypothetical protein